MSEKVTLYRCGRCGEYSFGLCARGRCHGIPKVPGADAKPLMGEPVEFVPASHLTRLEEEIREDERRKLAAFLREAVDETEGMEEPHKRHMFRVKILSRISALEGGGDGG